MELVPVMSECPDELLPHRHTFYVRKHADGVLFVANVYAGVDSRPASTEAIERCLRETWASCGEIKAVELLEAKQASRSGMRTVAARVAFARAEAVDAIMSKQPRLVTPRATALGVLLGGAPESCDDLVARHVAECVDARVEEEAANQILALFEADRAAEIEARARAREAGPDADGFVTVTYKRKAINEAPRESEATKKRHRKAAPRATGAEAHRDFYRFQKTEAKKARLAALRSNVEADKERTAKVAAHRRSKFKPA